MLLTRYYGFLDLRRWYHTKILIYYPAAPALPCSYSLIKFFIVHYEPSEAHSVFRVGNFNVACNSRHLESANLTQRFKQAGSQSANREMLWCCAQVCFSTARNSSASSVEERCRDISVETHLDQFGFFSIFLRCQMICNFRTYFQYYLTPLVFMIGKLEKGLRLIDLFGTPLLLNFDGQTKLKSVFGGLSTIIVIAFIVLTFQSQIQVYARREQLSAIMDDDFFSNPGIIELNPSEFLFAVKIEQPESAPYAQRPFFMIKIEQELQTLDNGVRSKTTQILELAPCTVDKFKKLDANFENAFTQFQLQEFLCPVDSASLFLQGSFMSAEFRYVSFEVQSCQGRTGGKHWDVECATSQEIENYLNEQGQFRFVIYYTNSVVNPDSLDSYKKLYLSDDLTFVFQPKVKQHINVFFKEYVIQTDQSMFIGEDILQETVVFREEGSQKIESVFDLSESNTMVIVYFRSDFIREFALRKGFQKIGQLLAYFGGIFNIALIGVGFFVKMVNEVLFNVKIANRLYSFVNRQELKAKFFADKNNYYRATLKLQSGDRFNALYQYFRSAYQHQVEIRLSISYLLYLISCKKKFRTVSNRLIEKSLKQIQRDMDVRILLRRVQEISKMQKILFTSAQKDIFSFSERPNISLHDKLERGREITMISRGEYTFKKLLEAYKKLASKKDDNINARLINSLGVDVLKILQLGSKALETDNQTQQGAEENKLDDQESDNMEPDEIKEENQN